eukprot:GEMP01050065.1.p1 GENE.GEMP01050065.1~~GEMP01050065.1.p1  ORF type:complete len:332 (+),score=81.73 GEMP01050065.1:77-1072(+)
MVKVLFIGDIMGQVEKACRLVTKTATEFDFPALWSTQDLIEDGPDGKTLGASLNFLGHYGVKKINGLTIAYLSGTYDAEKFDNDQALFVEGHYTKLTIDRLVEEIELEQQLDILLTTEWPENVERHTKRKKTSTPPPAAPPINRLLAAEPRYWLTSGNDYGSWKREPWRQKRRAIVDGKSGETIYGITRFIALDPLSKGASAFHALNIDPHAKPTKEDWEQATPAPSDEEGLTVPTPASAEAASEKVSWKPSFGMADAEERRRWKKMFGINPEDMSNAQDVIDQRKNDAQDAGESTKRVSLYKNQRPDKRKRGGGSNMTFQERERKTLNNI